jgi:hypothetical protein
MSLHPSAMKAPGSTLETFPFLRDELMLGLRVLPQSNSHHNRVDIKYLIVLSSQFPGFPMLPEVSFGHCGTLEDCGLSPAKRSQTPSCSRYSPFACSRSPASNGQSLHEGFVHADCWVPTRWLMRDMCSPNGLTYPLLAPMGSA